MHIILKSFKKSGVLDYVSLWFVRAAEYIQGTSIQVAFVSTNSITQGEQVSILWKPLCEEYGIKIHFAHRTFKWGLEEVYEKQLKASAVYVVIIGFSVTNILKKTLFTYEKQTSEPKKIQAQYIHPYLLDMPLIFVHNRSKPLCIKEKITFGNTPIDNGNFLMTDEEKKDFLKKEPKTQKFIKPFISSHEYLHGKKRWVLWLKDINPSEYSKLPLVMERIKKVKIFRSKSPCLDTKNYPYHHLFREIRQPDSNYLLILRTTSENREYIPMSFFKKNNIVSDSCQAIPKATLLHFGYYIQLCIWHGLELFVGD